MCIVHTAEGISRDEVTQSSEEIKHVALSIVELQYTWMIVFIK